MADAAPPQPDAAAPADGPGGPAGSCSSAADCKATFECVAGACKGPALHWRFDEAGGSTALDSSGNDLQGTYLGAADLPAASTNVPVFELANPASRAFVAAQRHQVRLASMPALLRPANGVTLSAWFRTRFVDVGGYSLIANGGDGYFIVIDQSRVWLARGVTGGTWVYCSPAIANHLDGNWHHVAGVLDESGMRLYFDGVERCSNQRGDPLVYDGALGVLVARRGVQQPQQFDGNIDDLRIYTRVLTAAQILTLARGRE